MTYDLTFWPHRTRRTSKTGTSRLALSSCQNPGLVIIKDWTQRVTCDNSTKNDLPLSPFSPKPGGPASPREPIGPSRPLWPGGPSEPCSPGHKCVETQPMCSYCQCFLFSNNQVNDLKWTLPALPFDPLGPSCPGCPNCPGGPIETRYMNRTRYMSRQDQAVSLSQGNSYNTFVFSLTWQARKATVTCKSRS